MSQMRLAAHQYDETASTPSHAAGESSGYSEPSADGWSEAPAASMHCSCLWNEIQSDRCLWANVEYLSYWMKGNGLPPLVTTSPTGTPQADAGVLGEPNTRILFGNERVVDGQRNGGRITVGGWWVGDVLGIEGNYWALGRETTNYRAVSDFSNGLASTDPILARPFTNAALGGVQDSLIVAFPGFNPPVGLQQNVSGRINVSESSEVQSAGLGCGTCCRSIWSAIIGCFSSADIGSFASTRIWAYPARFSRWRPTCCRGRSSTRRTCIRPREPVSRRRRGAAERPAPRHLGAANSGQSGDGQHARDGDH